MALSAVNVLGFTRMFGLNLTPWIYVPNFVFISLNCILSFEILFFVFVGPMFEFSAHISMEYWEQVKGATRSARIFTGMELVAFADQSRGQKINNREQAVKWAVGLMGPPVFAAGFFTFCASLALVSTNSGLCIMMW